MTLLFVDTAGWLSLADRSQPRHPAAAQQYQEHVRRAGAFVTTNYVLAELIVLFTIRTRLPRSEALAFVAAVRQSERVQLVHVDAPLDAAAWDLLGRRLDKEWSLTDAASFVVMEHLGISEALTTDDHFRQAGFVVLL